jgi:uroporphyrin-3 C-methyltransferase
MEDTVDNKTEQDTVDNSPVVASAAAAKPQPASEPQQPDKGTANKQPKDNKQKRGGGKLVAILALLFALIAIIACVYIWYLQQQQQQQFQGSQGSIAGAIQRVDQQSDQNRLLQRQLDRQVDSAKQQQQQLERQFTEQINGLRRQLNNQQKKLASLSTTDRDDWLLAEAEYLVRLANQRLLMGKEVKGAMNLLAAADEIARELDDTALYPFRQALADDMAALRSASRLDIEGVYMQLGALARQVDQLRLFELPELQLKKPEPTAAQSWQQRLDSGLQAAWAKLGNYVQIKRSDEVYQPLLAPEYEAAVRQNVRLMFEQAQMAALAGKQRLYDDSLAKAKQWLRNYYTLDKTATRENLRRIDELAALQITLPLPDISGSLRELKQYLENLRPSTSAASKPATSAAVEDQEPAQ